MGSSVSRDDYKALKERNRTHLQIRFKRGERFRQETRGQRCGVSNIKSPVVDDIIGPRTRTRTRSRVSLCLNPSIRLHSLHSEIVIAVRCITNRGFNDAHSEVLFSLPGSHIWLHHSMDPFLFLDHLGMLKYMFDIKEARSSEINV